MVNSFQVDRNIKCNQTSLLCLEQDKSKLVFELNKSNEKFTSSGIPAHLSRESMQSSAGRCKVIYCSEDI